MGTAVAAILMFAGASFFFALAETALFSLSKWQARQLVERHRRAGGIVAQLLKQPEDLLATLALGNTFANAAVIALALWTVFNAHWELPLTMLALLALVLIGCEVLPKTLAVRQPERWALRVGAPLLLFQRITRPLHRAARAVNMFFLRTAQRSLQGAGALTDAEYQELLEMAFQQGTLAGSEKEIILQIISLDNRAARDVMRPRPEMACVSDDASVAEMIAAAKRHKHRRLPIYDETPDTIVGILNARALLLNPQRDLAEAIEFPSFVPETMNLLRLFQSLQKQQRGLAIVLDEFGGVAGLVTMEDILGTLIGKMPAASPPEGLVMEKTSPGRWRVSGTMRLDDFRREYPPLGEVAEVETMGGLLAQLLGVVPQAGEWAEFGGLKLTAHAVDERRVREVLVERLK
ncbi:MAG: HlyC/CorC family transporter [Verrucomicrobiota bacterium]|nr:hemolysin family protein [Verrucomicrobiota bacterium]MDE3067193.1 HlyC/CorC family transporter [Verrucomicrobiota bacterium]